MIGWLNPEQRRPPAATDETAKGSFGLKRNLISRKVRPLTIRKLALILLCLMPVAVGSQQSPKEAQVTPLLSQDLPDLPGKEGVMITVVYPPGSSDPVHRHFADAFVYVLEGSIVMQVKGGKEVTLTPGQTFYEGPDDVHVVGRNASQTHPAKFVVFLVKKKGAPILVPEK
jgi:quercetin dioxygenase-like cupin family protein